MQRIILSLIFKLQVCLAWTFRCLGLFKQRLFFEKINLSDPNSKPWQQADGLYWAFHCSSEGEFEQLKPLMTKAIDVDQKIELIFTSPSVEKKVKQFHANNPDSVRYLRMPLLLNLRLSTWSKAQGLIMCRYDFFPELLLLPVKKRVLTWASLKGKKANLWLKTVYKSFNLVIGSTTEQRLALENLTSNMGSVELATYDFRPLQIQKRLKVAQLSNELCELIKSQPNENKIIVGSAWENDLHLFDEVLRAKKPFHLWLAPHQLNQSSLERIKLYWHENFPEIELISLNLKAIDAWNMSQFLLKKDQTVIWLLESAGVLVELYPLFDYAYVGGGFGRSIHSVLEPAIAGCSVCCGPKIHRSTEIDLVHELSPNQVSVVNNTSEFSVWWRQAHLRTKSFEDDKVVKAIENWIKKSDEIIGLTLAH